MRCRRALIAQGMTLPMHLGSIPDAMRRSWEISARLRAGDVYILNDPTRAARTCPISTSSSRFRRRRARRLGRDDRPSARHRRLSRRQRLRRDRDLSGGAADPAASLYGPGEPVEAVFDIIDRNVRVPRQGARRPAGPACRLRSASGAARRSAGATGCRRFARSTSCSTSRSGWRAPDRALPDGTYASRIGSTTTASIPARSRSRSRSWSPATARRRFHRFRAAGARGASTRRGRSPNRRSMPACAG